MIELFTNMNSKLDSLNNVCGEHSAYLFFLFVRNSELSEWNKNIMFDIIRFFIRSELFFRLDYFDQFKIFGETDLVQDNDDYFSKKTIYLKDISTNINPISGRRIIIDINYPEIFPEDDISGLGFKNIKYERLDLVEDIELEINGYLVAKICNNNNFFTILQKMYGITDKNIIPFGCIVKNYWFPLMNIIRLRFKFKSFNNDEKIDYPVVYELYQISDINYINQNDSNRSLSFSTLSTNHVSYYGMYYQYSKYKLRFDGLVTDLLISLTNGAQIKKCQILLCGKLPGIIDREFTWENNRRSTLIMDKIDNFYVFSFVPSLESRWLLNYGLECSDMYIHIDLDHNIDHDLNIFAICTTNFTTIMVDFI